MKKNRSTIILILIFLVGLSVMLYPTVSDYVNQRHQSRALASYDETVNEMSDAAQRGPAMPRPLRPAAAPWKSFCSVWNRRDEP